MDLKGLIEEYVISLELGQHKTVSELSPKICAKLIELLDSSIAEREDDDDDGGSGADIWQQAAKVVDSICDRIRRHDDIAIAYHDVRSFVHLYDMVCFSRMTGAIPHNIRNATSRQPEHGLPIDVDQLAYVMRSACHLLRYMNMANSTGWSIESDESSCWIDSKEQIDKISSVGFPLYTLKMPKSSSKHSVNHYRFISDRLSVCDDSEFSQVVSSEWFRKFLDSTLSQNYPLDRFSSLIALWIIADICRCNSLEQVMSELVDQIFHEESNSCNLEELLQLGGQIGSYWLSYHRRYRATSARGNTGDPIELEDEDDDDEDRVSLGSSSGQSDNSNDTGQSNQQAEENARARLRRLIRDELLDGPDCLVCSSRPREPLTCLRGHFTCHQCGSEASRSEDFCALSRRALPLLKLDFLEGQNLVLVSPSEWVRHALLVDPQQPAERNSNNGLPARRISERIDIEPTFERLTISRDLEPEDRSIEDNLADEEDDEEPSEWSSTLRAFMVSAARMRSSASESIMMMQFAKGRENLFLCSSDLLLLDQRSDDAGGQVQLQLRLAATSSLALAASGGFWVCNTRSTISRLPLGCSRLFSSIELLRRADETTRLRDGFTCCFCQLELRRVESFPADLF